MSEGLVLAIDTTGTSGSLALAEEGVVLEEVRMESPDGFGHVLFAEIEKFLGGRGVVLGDIALFAAAAGPGSFTGVRVGLAAAKGLAAALGRPAAGVSNLQALALLGTGERRAAVLDARRGDIFGGVFDAVANPLSEERVAVFPEWLAGLEGDGYSFVFQKMAPLLPALENSRFTGAPRMEAGPALAGAVARLAWQQAKDPAALDANYVRKSDAELFWVDR